jgi:putative adenylate-forming enzyme
MGVMLSRFARARWGYRFRSRARFEAWQRRRISRFLARLPEAPFYADGRAGGRVTRLDQLPITDKATMLAHFDGLNTRGVRLDDALEVALAAERSRDFAPLVAGDLTVGLSSGTSGRRGAFLVSPRERMLWAGTILARVLDRRSVGELLRFWSPPVRIAFFLRAGGNLYESVASSRIRFDFHDLTEPFEGHVAELARRSSAGVGPDIVVAPASVLGALAAAAARGEFAIAPRLVLSVAEVLEPETAEAVRAAWGVPARQVYQATEGLLAITCAEGSLHLNEESVHVEPEWLDPEHTRFTPLITDFDRRTQIIARHRLDDVLRLDPTAPPCPCGRVTTVLTAVDGRADSVLHLPRLVPGPTERVDAAATGEGTGVLFPDVLRQAMASGSREYADWRIHQRGRELEVALAEPSPDAETSVRALLGALFTRHALDADIRFTEWHATDFSTKRRRIVRDTDIPASTPNMPAREWPA